MKIFNPFALPLIKSSLPVSQQSNLFRFPPLNMGMTRKIINPTEEALQMLRRRVRDDGFEIIDKPTYHKLTKDFVRNGGEIRMDAEAKAILEHQGAYASYMVGGENLMLLRENPTVSDILEETYHAKQDRKNLFEGNPFDPKTRLLREIDAQKYLLSVADKYKIPKNEIELTKANLADYKKELKDKFGE